VEAEAEEMTNAEEMVEAQAAEAEAENNAEAQATELLRTYVVMDLLYVI